MKKSVSLVIRTKNEIKTISRWFDLIKNQKIGIETIIVDNESTDGTYEYCKKNADKVVTISEKDFSHAYSTNLGVEHASYECVFITNGHSLPAFPDEIFEIGLKIFNLYPIIAGVYGMIRYFSDNATIAERINYHFVVKPVSPRNFQILDKVRVPMMQTQGAFFRKSLVDKIPFEFLKANGGEDWLWGARMIDMGYKIAYHPKLMMYHSHGGSTIKSINRYRGYRKMYTEAQNKRNQSIFSNIPIPYYEYIMKILQLLE